MPAFRASAFFHYGRILLAPPLYDRYVLTGCRISIPTTQTRDNRMNDHSENPYSTPKSLEYYPTEQKKFGRPIFNIVGTVALAAVFIGLMVYGTLLALDGLQSQLPH